MSEHARMFTRLWGIALVAHVAGNWAQPDLPSLVGWLNLAVGLGGLSLVIWPVRPLLLAVAMLTLGSVVGEMPVTGNHWLVAGLVSLGIVVSGSNPARYLPASRWILIVFYGFAALAKLNAGFFDPTVSCAVFYSDQSLNSWGLPDLAGALTPVPIWTAAVIELSVPPLLAIRRTRYWGLLLATAFHTAISFDLSQHFYDFTAVLLALFFAFTPVESARQVGARWTRWVGRRRMGVIIWLLVAGPLVTIASLPITELTRGLLDSIPFLLWIPFSLAWLLSLSLARAPGQPLTWRLGPITAAIVLLTSLNGLTPYTELKTGYGFNMYSNLVTARGDSNHFLIGQTLPLRDGYTDPVEILETSDEGLDLYRQRAYLIAYPQLRLYLAGRPETSLAYRRGEKTFVVGRAGDVPELVDPGPWWWEYMPLRALDTRDPPRCQDVFLPAL